VQVAASQEESYEELASPRRGGICWYAEEVTRQYEEFYKAEKRRLSFLTLSFYS
jgi:hypothetical protein